MPDDDFSCMFRITHVTFFPLRQILALERTPDRHSIKLKNIETKKLIRQILFGREIDICSAALSFNGKILVAGYPDGIIRICKMEKPI